MPNDKMNPRLNLITTLARTVMTASRMRLTPESTYNTQGILYRWIEFKAIQRIEGKSQFQSSQFLKVP
jgi:hypothetical protein